MTSTQPFSLPDDIDKELTDEAAQSGITKVEALRRRMAPARPAIRQFHVPATESLPPKAPHKSIQEVIAESLETRTAMQLMRAMEAADNTGSRAPQAITAEDIAKAVERALDERLPNPRRRDDSAGDDPFKGVEQMLARKAQLKMLQEFSADDPKAQSFINQQIQALNARIETIDKARADAERELHNQQIEAVRGQADANRESAMAQIQALEARLEQVQTLRSQGAEPPRSTIDQILEDAKKLEQLRGVLGGGGNKPDMWDRIERVIDKGGELVGKGLEGVAAVEAGKRGVPPHATLSSSSEPPHYLDEGGAGRPDDEVIQLMDGQRIRLSEIPLNPPGGFSLNDKRTGQTRQVTRDEFIAEMRKEIRATGRANVRDLPSPPPPTVESVTPPPPAAATQVPPGPPAPQQPRRATGGVSINPFTREVVGAKPAPPPPTVPDPAASPEPEPTPEAPSGAEPEPEEAQEARIPSGVLGLPGNEMIVVDKDGHIVAGAVPDQADGDPHA